MNTSEAERMLADNPTHRDLRFIIYDAPEPYAGQAWSRLLADKPTYDDLSRIIIYAPEPYRTHAREILKCTRQLPPSPPPDKNMQSTETLHAVENLEKQVRELKKAVRSLERLARKWSPKTRKMDVASRWKHNFRRRR